MTSGIQSNGTDLDSIFAAYASGTHPAATGIEVNGTDIATRYQPLPGTAAAATGIETNGTDLNALFSTTSLSPTLPINGNSYAAGAVSGGTTPIKPARGTVYVQVGGGQYNVQTSVISNGAAAVIKNYTFTIPPGMEYFYLSDTVTKQTGPSTFSNTAAGWTAIPSSLTTYVTADTTESNNSGTITVSADMDLHFGTSESSQTSGSFTIDANADISA